MMFHCLSHLDGITVKLERSALDVLDAHEMIDEKRRFMAMNEKKCGQQRPEKKSLSQCQTY